MQFFSLDLPLGINVAIFVVAALAIGAAGTKLAGYADRLADRTGLGEALTGTILLGLTTALPGVAASVSAAIEHRTGLAISNAMGGIAVQTAALAVADIFYTHSNLEHAAASVTNMIQTAMLILLLTLVLLALAGPDVAGWPVHPMTFVVLAAAGVAFRTVQRARERPMWRPRQTPETVPDTPQEGSQGESLLKLTVGFVLAGAVTLGCGALVAILGGKLVDQTGLSESLVGGLFVAVATSLPELVTSIAAVRRGALTLAVSDIVGGNFFDVLFVCAADLAYIPGSLYHSSGVGNSQAFLVGLCILLNAILLVGLLYRQKHGPANIGVESLLMLFVYMAGFAVISFAMH